MTGSVELVAHGCIAALDVQFNVLRVACGLGSSGVSSEEMILVGDVEGKVHVFSTNCRRAEVPDFTLETKGDSIQSLFIHPITNLSRNDILTGDAQGVLTLFSNLELLSRESLPCAISAITVSTEKDGISRIFAGDRSGSLMSLGGLDLSILSSCLLPQSPKTKIPFERRIAFLETIKMSNELGGVSTYIIAIDGSPFIHIYSPTQVLVRSIEVPEQIQAVCFGDFTHRNQNQIMISCSNRCLYVIQNLQEVSFYAETNHLVTQLLSLNLPYLPLALVACVGHWNGVKLFHNKIVEMDYRTPEWIHTMDSVVLPSGETCLCIGQEDNTISLLEITRKQSETSPNAKMSDD